jgi:hypothetical protein
LVYFIAIWYIFPVLVFNTKKNIWQPWCPHKYALFKTKSVLLFRCICWCHLFFSLSLFSPLVYICIGRYLFLFFVLIFIAPVVWMYQHRGSLFCGNPNVFCLF